MYSFPDINGKEWGGGGGGKGGGGGIVTSSAFQIPWETSWYNQNTGVYKGSIVCIYMCVNSKRQKSKYRKEGQGKEDRTDKERNDK